MACQARVLCLFLEVGQVISTGLYRAMGGWVRELEEEGLVFVIGGAVIQEDVYTLGNIVAEIVLLRREGRAWLIPFWSSAGTGLEGAVVTGTSTVKIGERLIKAAILGPMAFVIVAAQVPFANEGCVVAHQALWDGLDIVQGC